ncbi:hypothetical protein [Kineococcus sp. SYSU DK001]|uniref:hypothetical protein n=1 Tax=Kineococcus sp. SYSU DK001 TaxID=3383122 RepID=UPI003D7CFAFA
MTTGDTLAGIGTRARGPVVQLLRRLSLLVLVLVVAAGAAGLFGVRSASVTERGGGYELTVTHPRTARAGLDAPWVVELTAPPEGFGDTVELAVRSGYFEFWEQQGFIPTPAEETADGDWYYMTFTPPPGREFRLSFDAYVQPSSQRGGDGEVAVVVGGQRVVAARFSTWLAP